MCSDIAQACRHNPGTVTVKVWLGIHGPWWINSYLAPSSWSLLWWSILLMIRAKYNPEATKTIVKANTFGSLGTSWAWIRLKTLRDCNFGSFCMFMFPTCWWIIVFNLRIFHRDTKIGSIIPNDRRAGWRRSPSLKHSIDANGKTDNYVLRQYR